MKFIRIFGRWFVARENRCGWMNEHGEIVLCFPGLEPGATVCIDGHPCRTMDEGYVLRVGNGVHEISIMLPDGMVEEVEDVVVDGATVKPVGFSRTIKPVGFDPDCFILELAERLQALEAAEAEDRREIQHYNDRKSGKLFLGGTKR